MRKKLKEARRTIYEEINNINKDTDIIEMTQIEILELQSTTAGMKNSLEFNSRDEQAEGINNKSKDKTTEITQSEKRREEKG